MKKMLSVFVFVSLLFTVVIPVAAQRAKGGSDAPRGIVPNNITQFAEVEAYTDGQGTLVRWKMHAEFGTVGFEVFATNGMRRAVNDVMIVGSAAKAGERRVLGESYEVFDPLGGIRSTYIVESVDLNGVRIASRPVRARFVFDLSQVTATPRETLIDTADPPNRSMRLDSPELPPDLRDLVSTSQQVPDLETQRWLAGQPGAKIAVNADGFYKVSCAQLAAAEFDTASNSANWRLFRDGVEQAINVGTGDRCIEFYGRGIDTVESDTRTYYLISGPTAGKRIGTRVLRPFGGGVVLSSFPASVQKRERISFISRIINGEADNFWGRIVASSPTNIPFTVSGISFSSPTVQVTIRMQGFSTNAHSVRPAINGMELAPFSGTGQNPFAVTVSIPTSALVEGENTLELRSLNAADFSLFDSITVGYARKFEAYQGRASFFTPGLRRVDLSGFATPNIRVFDTTRDGEPILLSGMPVVQNGDSYTVRMPAGRSIVAYGVEDPAILQPVSVTRNLPSTLATAANAADMIIIAFSHPDFLSEGEAWANYRRSQGYAVKVVDVTDIYDEFNFGTLSSGSINSFLRYAAGNWQNAPEYVLLLGDASYDPRNYLGYGQFNYVPTETVDLIYGESGSDEALADFNNDGLSEMAIGRIPARVSGVITIARNKTVQFESTVAQGLERGALFAHDINDGWNFYQTNMEMRAQLPPGMPVTMVARSTDPNYCCVPPLPAPDPNAHQNLIEGLNTLNGQQVGRFIVNYSGHGSSGIWASSGFFGIGPPTNHVPLLTNANSQTIFTMLTCLNGYFIRPDADSLSEVLLKSSTGGAVATWSSTGETTPDIQTSMGVRFYNQFGVGTITRIGDLIKDAKTEVPGGSDVRLSWALLGDPMLKVRQ